MSQRSAVRAWLRGERLDRHLRAQGHTCHIIEKLNTEINVGLADPKLKLGLPTWARRCFLARPATLASSLRKKPRSGVRWSSL